MYVILGNDGNVKLVKQVDNVRYQKGEVKVGGVQWPYDAICDDGIILGTLEKLRVEKLDQPRIIDAIYDSFYHLFLIKFNRTVTEDEVVKFLEEHGYKYKKIHIDANLVTVEVEPGNEPLDYVKLCPLKNYSCCTAKCMLFNKLTLSCRLGHS